MITIKEISLSLEMIELEDWLYQTMDLAEDESLEYNLNDFKKDNFLEVYVVTEFEDNGWHRFIDFLFDYDFDENTGVHRGLEPYMSWRAIDGLEKRLIAIAERLD